MKKMVLGFVPLFVVGCANIDFNSGENGAVYFEPVPYLFYTVSKKCVRSATVVTLPGKKRHLDFSAGYGSSSLSAEFSNGLLSKVGQTSDTKISETLTSIAAAETAGLLTEGAEAGCPVESVLFPIEGGKPDLENPLHLIR